MVALSINTQTAQTKKKKPVVYNRDRTVIVMQRREIHPETRTRVIIQKQSYLDPGTEKLQGERSDHFYAELPNQRERGVIDDSSRWPSRCPVGAAGAVDPAEQK